MQETQAGQNEQLAKVKPEDFTKGIAIMSQDGNDHKLKYICELTTFQHPAAKLNVTCKTVGWACKLPFALAFSTGKP